MAFISRLKLEKDKLLKAVIGRPLSPEASKSITKKTALKRFSSGHKSFDVFVHQIDGKKVRNTSGI